MVTELGKFIRKCRIEMGVVLGDMAEALGISVSWLSAVEHGEKRLTTAQIENAAAFLNLQGAKADEFRILAKDGEMNDQPEIIRDYSYPLFTAQINPEAYYLPSQFKCLKDTLPFYKHPRQIYCWLKEGKIDCIQIAATRRRLIQGKDFISFLFGE